MYARAEAGPRKRNETENDRKVQTYRPDGADGITRRRLRQ